MFIKREITAAGASDEWAIHSEKWIAEVSKIGKTRKRRERNSNPLILCGHGISMRIENGALFIKQGFSHYPQSAECYRYFPGSRDIPKRILILDGSGSLSFDVLSWLAEQDVALARIKWTGEVAVVASGTGYASDPTKVRWQHEQNDDHSRRVAFVTDLIRRKLIASLDVLADHIPHTPQCAVAIDWHRTAVERLEGQEFTQVNDVRGIEGQAASLYFRAWQGFPVLWKGKAPVPDDWRAYDIRSSMANGAKPQNRSASHPINAMLNYGYAVKSTQLQIQAIAQGYDPTIGILHHGRRGKPAFVFDMLEPERPKVDAAILSFIASHSFSAADFILRKDGVCRLSPQLARVVATLVAGQDQSNSATDWKVALTAA